VVRTTDTLLRSLMSQEVPMPPGARLIVTLDGLPPPIRDRVTHGDLRDWAWRAWIAEGYLAFMAAERLTARAPPATPEVLRVIGFQAERETRGVWRYSGGGQWDRIEEPGDRA
jgi:hypothetical protein